MKKIIAVFVIAYLFFSCQKELKDEIPNPVSSTCRLTRMTEGLHNDTVFLISYNAQGKISSIYDSTYDATLKAAYDASGRLVRITFDYSFPLSVEYNSKGLPYRVTDSSNPDVSVYTYEYGSNNLPVKRTMMETYDFNGITTTGSRNYEYNATDDIIRTLDYDPADTADKFITEYTYTNDTNIFGELNFFASPGFGIGFYEILNIDFYFNKRMVDNYISYDQKSPNQKSHTYQTYTHDSLNRITGIISNTDWRGPTTGLYTRNFFYDCK